MSVTTESNDVCYYGDIMYITMRSNDVCYYGDVMMSVTMEM